MTVTNSEDPYERPVAIIAGGDREVGSGGTVTLDGNRSTIDTRTTLTYRWERTGGTSTATGTLTGATTATPSFTAETLTPGAADVTHILALTVTDGQGVSSTATVTITVIAALVANAGPDQPKLGSNVSFILSGTEVTLDGSGSTASGGGRTVTYAWTRAGGTGSAVNLSDTTVVNPTFTPTLNPGDVHVTYIFTLTVTDNSANETETDTVTIRVRSGFADPVAQAGDDEWVGSGGTVTIDGSGSTVDYRIRESSRFYSWARTGGTSTATGTLTGATTAMPSFTAETRDAGAPDVTHILTLTFTDFRRRIDTDTVTITVRSLFAEAGEAQSVASGATVTLDGSGSTATDSSRVVTYAWTQTGGTTVTLSNTTVLDPTFTAQTLNPGDADVTYEFTLTVTDDKGSSDATDTVTITVRSLFAEAGEAQSVASGATVTLDGSGSTATDSSRVVTYAWTQTGGTTVTLSNTTVLDPTFTAQTLNPGDADVTYEFTLTVTDDKGSSDATDTVTITVRSLFAEAGEAQSVASGATVTLDGSGRVVTYAWTQTGGTTVTLSNTTVLDPTFMAQTLNPGDADVTYEFTLTVTDDKGSSDATDTVTITVKAPPFGNLVAEAGPDQDNVGSGTQVTLDGSGSTPTGSGRVVTYAWTQTGGTTVTLSNTTVLDPTFTAQTLNPGDADVTYEFTLTVTDDKGSTDATDTVTITVKAPPFGNLVAEAGPDQDNVGSGTQVTLDGSGSTPTGSGRVVTYAWTQTGGATVTLSNTTVLDPTFTAQTLNPGDADVTYEFTLTVTDDKGSTDATDTVTITVKAPPFGNLVAEAGPDQDNVGSGTRVTLDGSGSTPTGSGRNVTYTWTQTGGATVTLSNTTVLDPTFTAQTLNPGDADVTYEFTLTVTDDKGSTDATDTVTITVKAPPFGNLVAEAGPDQDNVGSGATVTLDGSGSTPTGSGRVVTYAWTQTGGTTVTLSNTTVLDPTFTAQTLNPGDADVTYEFTLTVTDDKGSTDATDTVTITVKAPPFGNLVAEAGPDQDNVGSGTRVTLDGSGSTPTGSGRNVTYAWTQTGGATVTLSNTTVLDPTFTAQTLNPGDADVTYEFTLTVTDDKGSSDATDTVTITVKAPPFGNLVAEAGPDQDNVGSGTQVTLDGSGSTPTGSGRTVTYAWTQTGGTTVTLSNTTVLDPTFTAQTLNPGDADVTYEFTLTVTDDKGSSDATDTVTITVKAPPFGNLVAEAGPDQDNVGSGTRVTLNGSGSTPTDSGRNVTYAWTQTGGATVTLSNTTVLDPTFTAQTLNPGDADVTYEFTLTVTDDKGSSDATDTVTITVKAPPFGNLVAEAGPDQDNVGSGTQVTLDGSGSTPTGSGRNVTYAWTQTGGTTVTLSNTTVLDPTFTAQTLNPGDADVTYEFTLTVTDDKGSTDATDTVTITVKAPPFGNLVAEAGPDQDNVGSGTQVTLDGSGSTPTGSGRNVTYAWTQTGGATVTLSNTTVLDPTFTAQTLNPGDADVTYEFTLTVTDDKGSSDATDTVTITVKAPPFGNLVAEAGPDQDNVGSGTRVTLDGSGSTPTGSGRVVTYAWTQTGGATVTLSNTTVLDPTFTAQTLNPGDADVTYEFTLTVTDDKGSTDATDTVTITVKAPPFGNLVAEAGPDQDNVGSGTQVTLDGSGSTPTGSGRVVTYAWTQTGGATVTLSNTTVLDPTFTAQTLNPGDADVTYEFTLTVTDDKGSSDATDTVKAPPFGNLVAEAGTDQDNVGSGTQVTLDGSGSTPTGSVRTVTYAWTQTGGTTVTLSNTTVLDPTFTAQTLNPGDADVTYEFTLTVTDDKGSSDATDTVTITVKAPPFGNLVAEAGPDQDNVGSGTQVTLDGSGSTPTVGVRTVTYAWARTGGTGDDTVAPSNPAALQTSFTAEVLNPGDASVTHIFTLTLTDNQGSTQATDTVTFTVTAPPFGNLVAEAGTGGSVDSGTRNVELDGTGSTESVGVRTVTYAWARTGGTGDDTVAPSNPAALQTSFTAEVLNPGDASVTHIFTLTVTDNQGSTQATDTVTFTVTALAALVAEAGDARSVVSGTQGVQLDGTGSTLTGGGRAVTYLWDRTGGDGATVTLTNADTLRPTFTAQTLNPGDAAVTYIFTLTVTDDQSSAAATDTVTVTAVPVDILDSPFELIGVSPLLFGLIVSAVDILVSPSELTVQEGGSSAYQVRLSESPGQDVIVMAVSDNENVVLENERLLFNANNWDAWQEIRIRTVAGSENADGKTLIEHRLDTGGVTLRQSGVVSVTVREEDPVLRPVGENLTARAMTLLNNLPNLSSFLKQDRTTPGGSGGFTFKATDGRLTLDGGFVRDGVWGEIAGSYTRSDYGDTRFVLGSFGIHRKYSERFLAGAMLQIDLADHDLDGKSGSIDGTGWLVGPYFAARHGTWPLYFEGRLLYGQSDNDIRFNDSDLGKKMRMGSFDTTRLLAQLRLEGEIALSDGDGGPRLIPYADTHWFEDRAAAFTDSIGTRISGQTVSIGQLELGSNVEVPIAMSHGAMTFTGGLGLVYSNTEGDYIPSVSRSRGRGEIGFSYGLDDNVRIDFESFYDGIGTSGYEGYGLSLNAEIKF